jgi:hypothetical protein
MWRTLADWLLAVLNMTRELEENRAGLRSLEARGRDMEEAIKMLAQEQRHARQLEAAERDKLLLLVERELAKPKELPAPKGRKGGAGSSR